MHLVIPFIPLMSSIVAAAPSVQHAQISVELTTMDARDQLDAPYSPEGLVINPADEYDDPENLPFNFTLSVQYANWGRDEDQDENLSFGFKDLKSDTFARGEIGFPTEFAFRKGFLINGNKALGLNPNRVSPGWTTLWPLKEDQPNENIFDLLVWPKQSGGKKKYFLEFTTSGNLTLVAFILKLFIQSIFEGAN